MCLEIVENEPFYAGINIPNSGINVMVKNCRRRRRTARLRPK